MSAISRVGEVTSFGPNTGIETFEPGRQDMSLDDLLRKEPLTSVSVNPASRERLSP